MNLPQKWLVSAITRYQRRGGGIEKFRVDCNFEPSCSEYTKQAVTSFGIMRGSMLALRRVSRCNARDQVMKTHDPVPAEKG